MLDLQRSHNSRSILKLLKILKASGNGIYIWNSEPSIVSDKTLINWNRFPDTSWQYSNEILFEEPGL